MGTGKFTYFRHSISVKQDPKMVVFKDLLGRKKKEAYHYYFGLLELCASESDDDQTEFKFHEKTMREVWEVTTQGLHEVCTAITLSSLAECIMNASHVMCRIENLPKYLGSYSTKERKEKERKVNKILEKSLLAFLFDPSDEIQSWLLTGTEAAQKDLLEKHSHHILAEEIKKAYFWQLEKSPRKAGTFLVTWMSNKKTTAFSPNQGKVTVSAVTPDNPTGNPFKTKLDQIRNKGKLA